MTRCRRCGYLNTHTGGFCESCGAPLPEFLNDETEILDDTPQPGRRGNYGGQHDRAGGWNDRAEGYGRADGWNDRAEGYGRADGWNDRAGRIGPEDITVAGWQDDVTQVDQDPFFQGDPGPGFPLPEEYRRVHLCPNCGAPMQPTDRFCVSCGSGYSGPAGFRDQYGQGPSDRIDRGMNGGGQRGSDKKLKSILSLLAICVGAGLLMAGVVYFLLNHDSDPDDQSAQTEVTTEQTAETTAEPTRSAQQPATDYTQPQTQPRTEAERPARTYGGDPYDGQIHEGDVCPYSSVEYLEYYEYGYLSDDDLDIAINEIYARHGAEFKEGWVRDYFMQQYWYEPTVPADQVKAGALNRRFNAFEKSNIDDMAAERKMR